MFPEPTVSGGGEWGQGEKPVVFHPRGECCEGTHSGAGGSQRRELRGRGNHLLEVSLPGLCQDEQVSGGLRPLDGE